jgi:hypothetical protein
MRVFEFTLEGTAQTDDRNRRRFQSRHGGLPHLPNPGHDTDKAGHPSGLLRGTQIRAWRCRQH